VLGATHLELDSIYHQPGWTPLDAAEFRRRVADVVVGDSWVIDGNYRTIRSLVIARVEVIVALELSRLVVARQVVVRSLRRGVRRQELWNGNRESLLNLLRPNRERNIVLWSLSTHGRSVERRRWLERVARGNGTRMVVVRTHEEADRTISDLLGVSLPF
jgi:hypothetical protein